MPAAHWLWMTAAPSEVAMLRSWFSAPAKSHHVTICNTVKLCHLLPPSNSVHILTLQHAAGKCFTNESRNFTLMSRMQLYGYGAVLRRRCR